MVGFCGDCEAGPTGVAKAVNTNVRSITDATTLEMNLVPNTAGWLTPPVILTTKPRSWLFAAKRGGGVCVVRDRSPSNMCREQLVSADRNKLDHMEAYGCSRQFQEGPVRAIGWVYARSVCVFAPTRWVKSGWGPLCLRGGLTVVCEFRRFVVQELGERAQRRRI